MALHCPECGFVNAEGANYCPRCGAFLGAREKAAGSGEPSTATYRIDETGELVPVDVGDVVADEGAALVIRAGGGRVGESFPLTAERMTIGRRPDSDIFLDDVTVSRDHALLVRRAGDYYLDDLGSLNGTYVNRHRIESHRLEDGDELQVGKFKLSYSRAENDHRAGRTSTASPRGARRGAASQVDDDRRRLQGARPGVPGHLDLEDPLPRGPEAAVAAAHRRAATGSTRAATSRGCGRSCACSATSSCRCGSSARSLPPGAPRRPRRPGAHGADAARRKRRPSVTAPSTGALYSLDDVVEETRAEPRLVAELEEYGVIKGEHRAGVKYYDETEREIVRAVTELARYGVGGRNLRAFRTSADREAALLQQILAPALRSRNAKRRKEAIEALENLAAVTTHLKHLLLVRDLRKIVG